MKENIVNMLNDALYKPSSEAELVKALKMIGKEVGLFAEELDALEKSGMIYKTKKGKYILPQKSNLVAGKLSKNKKGFGFLIPSIDKGGDLFIPASSMNGAMDQDIVMVSIVSEQSTSFRGNNREGEVVKILERGRSEITGTFQNCKNYGFLIGNDSGEDIFIGKKNFGGAQDGDKVVVKITAWPEKDRKSEGKIIEVLGKSKDASANVKALIRQYGLSQEFPENVLANTEQISTQINEDEIQKRTNLRHKTIITIDGADAKDLDDAVCVESLPNGNYLLGVHIADVSHYIKEGSKLDREAYKRGCSVYLLDQVIPMLPEKISNGVCSLNPHVDRLTMSVEMEINPNGEVVSHTIFESVIQTTERMVYSDVSDLIEKEDAELIEKYKHIYEDILRMNSLAQILRKKRTQRGSVDFDFDEAYITLNEKGIPVRVEVAERRVANKMIEEFMLMANETVSEHFFWLEIPFVYRVHEQPDPEKIAAFKEFIYNFGYKLKGSAENVHPKALDEIVKAVAGKPEENVINTVMLRSMKKAIYSPECGGHFGLGVKYYSHFTSPIRRYPDLLIHRIMKESITGQLNGKRKEQLVSITNDSSIASSETERNAEKIEREVEKLKKAEYMTYHIGEEFNGIISGVATSGFFVEIENTIEGFIRASSLTDDYYIFEKEKYRLIGERTKKIYGIGDVVNVKAMSADIEQREINFELI